MQAGVVLSDSVYNKGVFVRGLMETLNANKALLEEDYENGVYTYQSIGSVAISKIVGKGEKLIDVCSAPGGKSVALSENFNEIISCDVHEHRVELIKSYAQRMKKSNINAVLADATIFKSEF